MPLPALTLTAALTLSATPVAPDGATADRAAVEALDSAYQAAVKANDAETMARILANDFVLVLGDGRCFGKADLLREARARTRHYEQQDELERTVRVWGDTAVVTAKLWLKGRQRDGSRFDHTLWFSDTCARAPARDGATCWGRLRCACPIASTPSRD